MRSSVALTREVSVERIGVIFDATEQRLGERVDRFVARVEREESRSVEQNALDASEFVVERSHDLLPPVPTPLLFLEPRQILGVVAEHVAQLPGEEVGPTPEAPQE